MCEVGLSKFSIVRLCGALKSSLRTEIPWLLDHCDEKAGRSNPYQPLTPKDVYISTVVQGYNY